MWYFTTDVVTLLPTYVCLLVIYTDFLIDIKYNKFNVNYGIEKKNFYFYVVNCGCREGLQRQEDSQ